MNNKRENVLAFVFLLFVIIFGKIIIPDTKIYLRLLIGVSIGYILTRTAYGFAGSVNRAYRAGSTKLMRSLMFFFVIVSFISAGIFFFGVPEGFKLAVRPINGGLMVGAVLFGIGMAFNSCCASGTLTDIVTEFPKGILTLIFFSMGIFLAFPLQNKSEFVTKSWITSGDNKGVYLPDLFKNDGLNGFLGALLVTIILAVIVSYLAKKYEEKRKREGTYSALGDEVEQEKPVAELSDNVKLLSDEVYYRYFRRPWTMTEGVFAFSIVIAIMMLTTNSGWGVTSALGHLFGRVLYLFGMEASKLEAYTGVEAAKFTASILESGGRMQNLGIVLGTILMMLFSGNLATGFKSGLKISGREAIMYVLGGLAMGVGTRLSNGCNAGALLTPISQFSLSGWVFLIFMVIGGVIGNKLRDKIV